MGKGGFRRLAERLFDAGAQGLEGQGRSLAVQAFEFGDPFRGQHVAACRQNLPQLDEGRAEFLKREACAAWKVAFDRSLVLLGLATIKPKPVQHQAKPETRGDAHDFAQPGGVRTDRTQ